MGAASEYPHPVPSARAVRERFFHLSHQSPDSEAAAFSSPETRPSGSGRIARIAIHPSEWQRFAIVRAPGEAGPSFRPPRPLRPSPLLPTHRAGPRPLGLRFLRDPLYRRHHFRNQLRQMWYVVVPALYHLRPARPPRSFRRVVADELRSHLRMLCQELFYIFFAHGRQPTSSERGSRGLLQITSPEIPGPL
jgi:hypothetical protein